MATSGSRADRSAVHRAMTLCVTGGILLCLVAAALLGQRPAPVRLGNAGVFVRVGGVSPLAMGCNGVQNSGGSLYLNTTVEPYVAVDPRNPQHVVATWQQDRWSDGGASGVLSAVSFDGGHIWTTSYPHFSFCTGGAYPRASDPWTAVSPDGTAYQIAIGLDGITPNGFAVTAVLVSRSADGGLTWSEPTTLVRHTDAGDDKEMIVADPNDSHYVYAIWDRTNDNESIPAWFSRTRDGGATWDAARVIYNPGQGVYATWHELVVLPDGSLVDVFLLSDDSKTPNLRFAVLHSQDHGATWSGPSIVGSDQPINVLDLKARIPIRAGGPNVTVDPVSGAIYIVWSDSRFSEGQRAGIAFMKSLDGGVTWSAPVQVNQAPTVQAFTPAVAVDDSGRVAVTYCDFRKDTSDPATTLASYWRIISDDGGTTWSETPVGDPFDIRTARIGAGEFLGDYQGLVAAGGRFLSFYAAANTGNTANPISVFAESLEHPGDTRTTNRRIEVNPNSRGMRVAGMPRRKE